MNKAKKCPICYSRKITFNCKINSDIRNFNVFKCGECGLFFQNPIPTKKELKKFYNEIYSLKHNLPLVEQAFLEFDRKKERGRLEEIKRFKKKGKLLDVGASTGFFLKQLKKNMEWQGYGMEYSKKAVNIAKRNGINIKVGDFESVNFKSNYFDVITMHSVLEHIPDINKTIRKAHSLLKKDGLLVFNVPNIDSFEYNLFKLFKKPFPGFIYEHIYYFSSKTLSILLNNNNFKIVHITSRHYSTLRPPPKKPFIGVFTFPFKLILECTNIGGKLKKGNGFYVYVLKK